MDEDDNYVPAEEKKVLSGNDRKKDKYGSDVENFSVTNSGITPEDGIIRERSCTDLCFLITFFIFMGAMGFLTAYTFKHGEVEKLLAPTDGDSKICGHDNGYEDFDKLFITNFQTTDISAIFNSAVCVKKCPNESSTKIECHPSSHVADCNKKEILDNLYNSREVANICIPKSVPESLKEGLAAFKAMLMNSSAGRYLEDLYLSSRAIYASFGLGLVWCIIFIYLMSAFAETIAWICVVLIQLTLAGGSAIFYFAYT